MRRLLLLPAATLVVLAAPTLAATGPELEPPTTDRVALTGPAEVVEPGWSEKAKVPADLVGVIWRGDQDAEFQVEVQRGHGPWEEVGHVEREAAAEPGSEEAASVGARGAEFASAPIWVEDATAVRVRLEDGEVRRVAIATVESSEPEALSGIAGAIAGWMPAEAGAGRYGFGVAVILAAGVMAAVALGWRPGRVLRILWSRPRAAALVTVVTMAALVPMVGDREPAAALLTKPSMVARTSWGADLPWNGTDCPGGVQYAPTLKFAVVHHTVNSNSYTAAQSSGIVRSIWAYHVQTLHYCDIAYNFLVDRFGTIFEGRMGGANAAVIAGHTGGFNTSSTGIAVLGDFTSAAPPASAVASVDSVIAWKFSIHGVKPNQGFTTTSNGGGSHWPAGTPVSFGSPVLAHRDLWPTACNGNGFYPLLPSMRSDVITRVGSPTPPPSSSGEFVTLSPARLMDTRGLATVDGVSSGGGPLAFGSTRDLVVVGRGGVPASGVGAVALNVTVTAPSSSGFLTVFPTGEQAPWSSNLNFVAGQTVANLVIAKVGTDGKVSFLNGPDGTAHVIADVTGWFPSGAGYGALSPARLLDTRPLPTVDGSFSGQGPLTPGGTLDLPVVGRGGVPASGVGAVVLNVTVTDPTVSGFLIVFPTGEQVPWASNLNFVAGQTVPNLVISKVGAAGSVSFFKDPNGTANLVADVVGWLPSAGDYAALTPARLLDTRGLPTIDGLASGPGPLNRWTTLDVTVAGRGGVPATGVAAVVLNVTVTVPLAAGYVTVYPAGEALPWASNLNFGAGQTVPNLVIAKVGAGGKVSLFNGAMGTAHLVVDVIGWFPSG